MIYGKRNWIRRIPVKVAIAVKDDEMIFGPEDTVKNKISKFAIIVPGDTSAHEIALSIIKKFKSKIKLERIERVIPYGRGELSK